MLKKLIFLVHNDTFKDINNWLYVRDNHKNNISEFSF